MSSSCSFDGCTVDETGLCALSQDPSTCVNHLADKTVGASSTNSVEYSEAISATADLLGAPVLTQPTAINPLSSSRALGLESLNELMSSKYVNVVGILGEPESGKTACLASLYLLVSQAMLEGWSFADSRSLAAFEAIARGARDWNNAIAPEQMTGHTELADEHRPGFLHLRLRRLSDGRCVDLALPDIPGEWTQTLISSARFERFDFMMSAEVIWIVLDGRVLAEIEKRQGLIVRLGQLVGRLNTMFKEQMPRLLIVVTHQDSCPLNNDIVGRLQKELTRREAKAEIVNVAPFSDKPEVVSAGFGIANLIDLTVGNANQRLPFWPSSPPVDGQRAYLAYRRDQ